MIEKHEKIKNILAYLCLLFGESDFMKEIMHLSPDYIYEKWEQRMDADESQYQHGLHKLLKSKVFDKYCAIWNLL